MAVPMIVWRNSKPVKRIRTWTQVRRDDRRALYLMLESRACGATSWEGLPTLEVIRGRAAGRESSREPRYRRSESGA